MITELQAQVPVDDFETARSWYEIFVGRPPASPSATDEAVWQLVEGGALHVTVDAERSGGAVVTLLVDDLAQDVGLLAMRGIAPESVQASPDSDRRATIRDPAGNAIVLVERKPSR